MDVATIVLALGTLLGGISTVLLWLETRGERGRKKRSARIQSVVDKTVNPVKTDVETLKTQFAAEQNHLTTVVEAALFRALEPVKGDIREIRASLTPLMQMATGLMNDAIENLHHPDPQRARLDLLLDHLKDNVLTSDEDLELRRLLVKMKAVKTPGFNQELAFTVHPGDPTFASILLRTMELTRVVARGWSESNAR